MTSLDDMDLEEREAEERAEMRRDFAIAAFLVLLILALAVYGWIGDGSAELPASVQAGAQR